MANYEFVNKGFRTMLGAMTPYIARELVNEFGASWWTESVLASLYEDQKRDLPHSGDGQKLLDSLDHGDNERKTIDAL